MAIFALPNYNGVKVLAANQVLAKGGQNKSYNLSLFFKLERYNPSSLKLRRRTAKVAHLVEHDLAKVGVAGSSPVFRSESRPAGGVTGFFLGREIQVPENGQALVVELVDTQDLKSCSPQRECGFNSRLGHRLQPIRNDRFFYVVQHRYNI